MLRKITDVKNIDKTQKNEMFDLMTNFYANMKKSVFEKDLSEKNWVLMLADKSSGKIVGFSTQMIFPINYENREIKILFSGDTIIHKNYWGTMNLSLAFGELMIKLIEKYDKQELFWLLISKGFRTYKYLPAFFLEFYPTYKKETPENFQKLMDFLGKTKFPKLYDKKRGIVRAKFGGQYLKTEYHPEKKARKKHEIFYYNSNPNYEKGDELLCLTKLSFDNINPFIKRKLQKL